MSRISTLILTALVILSSSKAIEEENEFSMEYYYSLRVNQKQDLNFLLDTSSSECTIFNNKEKPFFKSLPSEDVDAVTASIEINGLFLKSFEFEVEKDETNINSPDCQGIIGFGIQNGKNDLMDKLQSEKIIKKKVLYFTTSPIPKIQFPVDIPKKQNFTYTTCKQQPQPDRYDESWICQLSHIYFPDAGLKKEEELSFNDTIEINSKVAFDAKSYYISAPIKFLEVFKTHFEKAGKKCGTTLLDDYTFISCSFTEDELEKVHDGYYFFEGYGYKIEGKKMFMKLSENNYMSLIRFRKDSDVWVFGYPFFQNYVLRFDYDNLEVGFRGETAPMNITSIWSEWNKENNESLLAKIRSNKVVMIIGIVCISIVVLLSILFIIRIIINRIGKRGGAKPLNEEIAN